MDSAAELPRLLAPRLYTGAQCRELDRLAIESYGLPGFELMQRAGRAAFELMRRHWPEARRLCLCCGKGNNAGDGYIVAGLARNIGLEVRLLEAEPGALGGDAARAAAWAAEKGVRAEPWSGEGLPEADLIVDALLGTGLRGAARQPYAGLIEAINGSRRPVLALDVPSGVDADTGAVPGVAVAASQTITFIGRKLGLYTGPAVPLAGERHYADLGVPGELLDELPGVPMLRLAHLAASGLGLPSRDANAYKHAVGHVLVVGGDHSMGGAVIMAAEAALRVGAGMVTVLTRAEHRPALLARRPEIMVADADDVALRQRLYERAAALVVGPGLGRDGWGRTLLEEALAQPLPTLLDADGLIGLAELDLHPAHPLVITPHVGEAAEVLGISVADVQRDRLTTARRLADRVNGVAVLKGAGSVLASRGGRLLGVCTHGNPGMASAGMGDVLSGIIGGLLPQLDTPEQAALLGSCLHSAAADRAADGLGEPGLLATDLLPHVIEYCRLLSPRRGEEPWAVTGAAAGLP